MDANQTHAGAWIHDEALQTASSLLRAASLRTTYARHDAYKLDTARYAEPSEIFGKVLFFALCGDHLQLPPVPKSSGLLAPQDGTSDEHKVGASMFHRIHYLFEMHTMKRFEDPTLIAILQKMRRLHGAKLTDPEWQALLDTNLDTAKLQQDPETYMRETTGWFESSYLWSIVSMAAYARATISARAHKQVLLLLGGRLSEANCSPRQGNLYSHVSRAEHWSHEPLARMGLAACSHACAFDNASSIALGCSRRDRHNNGARFVCRRQTAPCRQ